MITFDRAAQLVAEHGFVLGSETVPLGAAHGRVLTEPVTARHGSPRHRVSTMDGYAVCDADLAGHAILKVVGASYPGGAEPPALAAGETCRVFTGAPLPPGADRVVIQEAATRDGDRVALAPPPGAPPFWRERASDFAAGAELLAAGHRLDARALVVAAAADAGVLACMRRPRVTILATGDELHAAGSTPADSGTPDSASPGVAALAREWDAEIVGCERIGDDAAAIGAAARRALDEADVTVVIGGASVGERDLSKAALAEAGAEPIFAGVAMKPGRPVWLARREAAFAIGLPGNPTSAMVTARLLLAPLLARMGGGECAAAWCWRERVLGAPLAAGTQREAFIRARLDGDRVFPLGNQDSGAQATLAAADVLVRVAPGAPPRRVGESVVTLAF